MILYEVSPSDPVSGSCGIVEGTHKWSLPGVRCPACHSTWGSVGVAYPQVDLSDITSDPAFKDPSPVSLDKLDELRQSIAHLVPHALPLPPGTQFGAFKGVAEGPFCDFVWNGYWDILAKRSAVEALVAEGVSLPGLVKPEIDFKEGERADLMELQIEPRSTMIYPVDSPPICATCKRWGISRPEKIIIQRSLLPDKMDIFRVVNFPTIILVTQQFFAAVNKFGLTGISFNRVCIE